ncbi:MAG: ATP-binding protein, partial [Armatimonadetes bacterium]|nr:ATP-binding protein [Armatimonadota bacterium]
EVIRAITHDRFCLVEPTDIPSIGQLLVEMPLRSEEDYRALRGQIRTIAQQAGMDTTRAGDLVTAAAEAITNAIKHGTDPRAEIWVGEDSVVVRVSDRGPGIRPEDIPSVLFRHGFSTKVSLGMGYTIMLELADRLWLATSPAGTVLQLEKRVRPELEPEGFLPVAWEKL